MLVSIANDMLLVDKLLIDKVVIAPIYEYPLYETSPISIRSVTIYLAIKLQLIASSDTS